ncbi:MAG TPA: glycosyltransferase [Pseudoxanthomonas sp.]|nr:glycosyltransferase [Pseudoxanthomonas sp.]
MISFVIPAHNEERLLASTLVALQESARAVSQPFEVILVDDASDDDTALIAAAHGARVVRVEHRHIAAARNAGAAAAIGQWLVFVDADTTVNPAVLRAAVQALQQGAVGGGARISLQRDVAWPARWGAALLAHAFRMTGIAPGCFVFCTRAAFDQVGGFDPRYYAGEDVALSRALARQGRFVILRETVHTSARKLRTFSVREHVWFLLRFAWRRQRLLTSREHLDLWYGKRRD